jgi:hypothetical protein
MERKSEVSTLPDLVRPTTFRLVCHFSWATPYQVEGRYLDCALEKLAEMGKKPSSVIRAEFLDLNSGRWIAVIDRDLKDAIGRWR